MVRVDKWLWAARFYKTRSLAKKKIEHGKVKVNGQRCKPARTVDVGDQVEIKKGPGTLDCRCAGIVRTTWPGQSRAKPLPGNRSQPKSPRRQTTPQQTRIPLHPQTRRPPLQKRPPRNPKTQKKTLII